MSCLQLILITYPLPLDYCPWRDSTQHARVYPATSLRDSVSVTYHMLNKHGLIDLKQA